MQKQLKFLEGYIAVILLEKACQTSAIFSPSFYLSVNMKLSQSKINELNTQGDPHSVIEESS